MHTYIALFRGINVGGTGSLPMKELVTLLQDLGCREVRTYIQSGNAVFASTEADAGRLAAAIGTEVKSRRGFEPKVLLLTRAEFEQAAAANPFPEAESDPQTLHLGFLAAEPPDPNLEAIEKLRAASERWQLIGRVFYLYAPEGIGRSKLATVSERLLGVPMTDRNWRTVQAVADMAREI
ncbi:DUF1697 domain-containing protein [bacterium]|nr:MAG: DUF1697 domain-containing protein [bacterium]